MKYDIVTIGDASEDVFIRPAEMKVGMNRSMVGGKAVCFELGEKIDIESAHYEVGGSSANVAVGMARMGYKASIITAIGEDAPAERILKRFEREDVAIENINIKESNKTNFAVIIRSDDGERTILVYRGIKYENLKIKKSLQTRWYFLAPIGDNSEELEKALIEASAEDNACIAWNPGSHQIKDGVRHHRALLKNTTVLFLNREEALKFMDFPVRPRDEEVMKRLQMMGPRIVVMTKGGDGAKAYDGEVYYNIEILTDSKKIDATGAGDSFATGFLGRLLDENSIPSVVPAPIPESGLTPVGIQKSNNTICGSQTKSGMTNQEGKLFNKDLICEALKYAMIDSASVVGHVGAQPGLLSIEQIEKGITDHPRLQVEVYG